MKIINQVKPIVFLVCGLYLLGLGIFGYQDGEETDYILKAYLFFFGVMLIFGAYFCYMEETRKIR